MSRLAFVPPVAAAAGGSRGGGAPAGGVVGGGAPVAPIGTGTLDAVVALVTNAAAKNNARKAVVATCISAISEVVPLHVGSAAIYKE